MTFRLKSVDFESRSLKLSTSRVSKTSSNYFTIIIGRNGVGKSRLLSEIMRTFRVFDRSERAMTNRVRHTSAGRAHNEFRLRYEIHGSNVELINSNGYLHSQSDHSVSPFTLAETPRPEKVIATTVSPFDKFPMDRLSMLSPYKREELTESTIYRYLGTRNNVGQFSIKSQLSRVIESLVFASSKTRAEIHQLRKVFEFLNYQPRIRVEYKFKIERGLLKDVQSAPAKSVDKLALDLVGNSQRTLFYEDLRTARYSEEKAKESAKVLLRLARQLPTGSENFTFDLDFEQGGLQASTLQLYLDATQLRRVGLVSLFDFRLFRKDLAREGISIRDASSGEQCIVLTILGIASEISENSLVCVDEPEISLHPEWQEKFIDLLMRTFSNYSGCHFLLATHSPQILSRIRGPKSFVLTMDDGLLHPASDFTGMSSDYQLVEAFGAPGIRNEYLAREALAVLTQLSTTGKIDSDNSKRLEMLVNARADLSDKDPVAKLIDAIISAEGITRDDR